MIMGVGAALTFIVVWPALVLGIASLYLGLTAKAQFRSGKYKDVCRKHSDIGVYGSLIGITVAALWGLILYQMGGLSKG